MRYLVSLLAALACGGFAQAASPTTYSAEQEALLVEVKTKTIELVERQKNEAEKLRRCFAFASLCAPEITPKLALIRAAITQKSEEYRLLVGLAENINPRIQPSARLSLTLPTVIYPNKLFGENVELSLLDRLQTEDREAIAERIKSKNTTLDRHRSISFEGYEIIREQKKATHFYRMQALMVIHQVPFIIYLPSDHPTDNDIAKALGKYIERINSALMDLYDEGRSPLHTFLLYEPVVKSIVDEDSQKKIIAEHLLLQQAHLVGIKAWIERNSPSLKLAALSTCSLVAAVLQAWPVSLACGGTVAALTTKQLYDDYFRMRDNFALWLTGVQSEKTLKNSEARVLYSSLALFFAGQSVGTTIIAIETSLVTTLSALPTVAAARFTSLTALREGGLRFASRTIEMKGKDLGASIFAASYSNITDKDLLTTREDRIFTYKDLLLLQDAAMEKN